MKHMIILGDGMADYPVAQLGNRSPLQAALKPNIDFLAQNGEVGMVKTVPDGMSPGSDTANLSVMGYSPLKYYSGRSPLEAVSMGIALADTDVTFRCNLVTLSEDIEDYRDKIMIDYSSDEISTQEAQILIDAVNKAFGSEKITFYRGISYRHCMVWKEGPSEFRWTPPHDILEKSVGGYLPAGPHGDFLLDMMVRSYGILKEHPINLSRKERGLRPANSIWLWGDGKKPLLPDFYETYGLKGSVISAVDLIKGIGICAGLRSVDVEGATGNIHTNFSGKAGAALKELEDGRDFVYLHIEAPDECGHRHEVDNKVKSIEMIDRLVVGPVLEALNQYEDFKLMILPDHPTPLSLRTHTSDPVPYVLYQKSRHSPSGVTGYDEFNGQKSGNLILEGWGLMRYFIDR